MNKMERNDIFEDDLKVILNPSDDVNESNISTDISKNPEISKKNVTISQKKKMNKWVEILIRLTSAVLAIFLLLHFAVSIAFR